MAKIDLDKLICSLINEDVAKLRVDPKAAIYDALRAQGLSYKDGAIVEIEPKFKVKKGKWYVCTDTFVSRGKIIAIKGQTYQSQQEDDTITCEDKCLFIDRHDGKASDYFRYWTIQDAKDGDVLATSAGAFIYNGNNGGGSCPGSYCGINTLGEFKTGIKHHWTGKKVYPATKEQQDLLFAKMKEAGYMWDANEKKLEKIEQKAADKKGMNLVEKEMTPFQKKVFCIIDTIIEKEQRLKQVCGELLRLAHVKIMQESAWSEKYIADVFETVGRAEIAREQGYDALTKAIRSAMIELSKFTPQSQNRRKPSDEQMEALRIAYEVGTANESWAMGKLKILYNDLKKLKG